MDVSYMTWSQTSALEASAMMIPFPETQHWFSRTAAPCQQLPPHLQALLFSQDSLTQRLRALTANFSVHLRHQGWSTTHQCWQREVVLLVDQQPWILARTLIPDLLWKHPKLALSQLQQRPLGELLYGGQGFQAQEVWVTQVEGLWLRRRPFVFQTQHLMVDELFLPAAMAHFAMQHSWPSAIAEERSPALMS